MPSRRDSLRERIAVQAAASTDEVFLTREFRHLGCERHVLRALKQLVAQGRLIRLGYGAYGRAENSRLVRASRFSWPEEASSGPRSRSSTSWV